MLYLVLQPKLIHFLFPNQCLLIKTRNWVSVWISLRITFDTQEHLLVVLHVSLVVLCGMWFIYIILWWNTNDFFLHQTCHLNSQRTTTLYVVWGCLPHPSHFENLTPLVHVAASRCYFFLWREELFLCLCCYHGQDEKLWWIWGFKFHLQAWSKLMWECFKCCNSNLPTTTNE